MTEDTYSSLLRGTARAVHKYAALGTHPVALCLRDIAITLQASGKWDAFIFAKRGEMNLHARSLGSGSRLDFDSVAVRSWRAGTDADEIKLRDLVTALLVEMGCRHTDLTDPVNIGDKAPVYVRNIEGNNLSAHQRLAIIADVQACLDRIDARGACTK